MTPLADATPTRLEVPGPRGPVPALLWTPAGAARPPLLLFGHGGGANGKDGPVTRRLCARLTAALDVAVLALDGPAHGERRPRAEDPLEALRQSRRTLVDPQVTADVTAEWRAAVDAVSGEVDTAALLYLGFSMGALFGLPVCAALAPSLRAAVFAVGGLPTPGGAAALSRRLGVPEVAVAVIEEEDDAAERGRVALEAAGRLEGVDVLMLQCLDDELFPFEGALRLHAALPGPKRLAAWSGRHTDLPDEAVALAVWFLGRALARPDTEETEALW